MSKVETPTVNLDFVDFLEELNRAQVDYLVIGAYAMAAHGVPRATGDLDVWVRPTLDNSERVVRALNAFGAPIETHGVKAQDFSVEGVVYQMGLPPSRIDILTAVSGLSFSEAFEGRIESSLGQLKVCFLSREHLLRNKRATGRDKDLVDVRVLEAAGEKPTF